MTLPELLSAMSILAIVMTGILVVFVGGLNATTRMNSRFQAQQDARLALSSLRNEVGFACSATAGATPQPSVALLLPDPTTNSCTGSTNNVTWCAASASGPNPPFGLYRQVGNSCSASTGVKRAGSLQTNTVFSNPTCTVGIRPQLTVSLQVNANFGATTTPYKLGDTITMRNAGVQASCP